MSIKLQRKSDSGFTLIELLVVITLIGIMAAIATPGFRNWKVNADLNADMRRLYGFFQKARMEAVKQNSTCNIVLDGTTFVSTIGAETIHSGAFTLGTVSDVYAGSFDRRGWIDSNTTITVTAANGMAHDLVINIRGRMRIE